MFAKMRGEIRISCLKRASRSHILRESSMDPCRMPIEFNVLKRLALQPALILVRKGMLTAQVTTARKSSSVQFTESSACKIDKAGQVVVGRETQINPRTTCMDASRLEDQFDSNCS